MSVDTMRDDGAPDYIVCRAGHPVDFADGAKPPKFCARCGDATINACEQCHGSLPAFDGDPAATSHCTECGAAYPWRLLQISHAKRTMEIAASTGNWDDETKHLAGEFVDDLAALRMSGFRLAAIFGYLDRYSVTGRAAFTNIARVMGSESVRNWLDERERDNGW